MRRFGWLVVLLMLMMALCSCNRKDSSGSSEPEAPKREGSDTVLSSSKRNVIYAYTLSDVTYHDQFTAIVI